jgi:hypothetical protein
VGKTLPLRAVEERNCHEHPSGLRVHISYAIASAEQDRIPRVGARRVRRERDGSLHADAALHDRAPHRNNGTRTRAPHHDDDRAPDHDDGARAPDHDDCARAGTVGCIRFGALRLERDG